MSTQTSTRERITEGLSLIVESRLIHPRLFGLFLGVVVWTIIATLTETGTFPQLNQLALQIFVLIETGVAFPNVGITLWRILWGFLAAMIVGITVGVLMGINNFGARFFTPYVILGLSIPAIAWAAVGTLIFGFSIWSPIMATALTTFPFIAVNVWKGVEGIDVDLIEMSDSFNVSRIRLLFRVIVPNTAPALFAAGRFGLAISWKVVTVVEIFASSHGIGYQIIAAYQAFQFTRIWAWAFLFFAVILLIEYAVAKPLEKRAYRYRQDSEFDLLG